MPRVARTGNTPISDIGSAPSAGVNSLFDSSSPASWTLGIWFAAVIVLILIYFSL